MDTTLGPSPQAMAVASAAMLLYRLTPYSVAIRQLQAVGRHGMQIEFSQHYADRVRKALARRAQLLHMTTHELPKAWMDEMSSLETTIAAAVAQAVRVQAQ